MSDHEQEKVVLKAAKIDIPMIGIVTWMNKSPSLFTTGSCQGNEQNPPGISFVALTGNALFKVIRALGGEPANSSGLPHAKLWEGEGWTIRPNGVGHELNFEDLDAVNYYTQLLTE